VAWAGRRHELGWSQRTSAIYQDKSKNYDPERTVLFYKLAYSGGVICAAPLASSLFGLAVILG